MNDAPQIAPNGQVNDRNDNVSQLLADQKAVYVKAVQASDFQGQPGADALNDLSPDARLYAVHLNDGTCVAVVSSREAAFAGARQYDMEPYSVH